MTAFYILQVHDSSGHRQIVFSFIYSFETKCLSWIRKGRIASSHLWWCNASKTSAFWHIPEEIVISGYWLFNCIRSFHSGAGAQDFTVMSLVRHHTFLLFELHDRLLPKAFWHILQHLSGSFNSIRFLVRWNRKTPNSSSMFFIERVTDGVEIWNASATFDKVPVSAKSNQLFQFIQI